MGTVKKATFKNFNKVLLKFLSSNNFQDPDKIVIDKQWNEFGQLKGYLCSLTFRGRNDVLVIVLDWTSYYMRVVGDTSLIPVFEPGIHKKWDDDPIES